MTKCKCGCGRQAFKGQEYASRGCMPVSKELPPARPYKDGVTYSPKTALYSHNCVWCGAEFAGSMDKSYCSTRCRMAGWRARRHGEGTHRSGKPRLLIGWASKRFAVLERDGFKCRYCGRGVAENVVLHVDHIQPKGSDGSDDLENLQTACQECNLGKGSQPLVLPRKAAQEPL